MLTMATIGFAVNFWAWALISPLGPLFRQQGTLGDLSESDVTASGFLDRFLALCTDASDFMRFLCDGARVPF